MEFGETNAASRVVYGLVGLAAVYGIGALPHRRRRRSRIPVTAGDPLDGATARRLKPKGRHNNERLIAILVVAAIGTLAARRCGDRPRDRTWQDRTTSSRPPSRPGSSRR